MTFSRNKLYTVLLTACTAGYTWIFFSFDKMQSGSRAPDVCLMKQIAHIPCPSCGSSRAVLALVQGHVLQSVSINPFGLIIALIMLIAPAWILWDIAGRKHSFLHFYRQAEKLLKRPALALPLILFVLINWVWNITKGL